METRKVPVFSSAKSLLRFCSASKNFGLAVPRANVAFTSPPAPELCERITVGRGQLVGWAPGNAGPNIDWHLNIDDIPPVAGTPPTYDTDWFPVRHS